MTNWSAIGLHAHSGCPRTCEGVRAQSCSTRLTISLSCLPLIARQAEMVSPGVSLLHPRKKLTSSCPCAGPLYQRYGSKRAFVEVGARGHERPGRAAETCHERGTVAKHARNDRIGDGQCGAEEEGEDERGRPFFLTTLLSCRSFTIGTTTSSKTLTISSPRLYSVTRIRTLC